MRNFALQRLAKAWPRTLTLASMGGTLVVVHSNDKDFSDGWNPEVRQAGVLATIDDIPNTGGDW